MRKIIALFVVLFTSVSLFAFCAAPVYAADDHCVKTSIIGNGKVCDDGDGSSVFQILNTVIDIMSILVGILGVIGITVVGVQYLTAGGNEEKTRKSKHRMLEIIIGIVVYILLYAGLKWLLPEFTGANQPGNGDQDTNQEQSLQIKTKDEA